jgi:uncharacterized paraquat-inducible protein A
MTSGRTASGNKRKKKIRVCLGCKFIYTSRKGNPSCPRCGRKHHTGRRYAGLLLANRRILKNKEVEK